MLKSSTSEKALLFLNNLAGDDLWEYGHEMLPEYQKTHIPHELFKYKPEFRNSRKSGVSITLAPYNLKGYGKIQIYGSRSFQLQLILSTSIIQSPFMGW